MLCTHTILKIYFSLIRKNHIILLLITIILTACQSKIEKQHVSSPNILFIAVDDLRPELGVYGNKIIKSPNIDKIANDGSFFKRHYVQVPTCGASRYSLMTGLRPKKEYILTIKYFIMKHLKNLKKIYLNLLFITSKEMDIIPLELEKLATQSMG